MTSNTVTLKPRALATMNSPTGTKPHKSQFVGHTRSDKERFNSIGQRFRELFHVAPTQKLADTNGAQPITTACELSIGPMALA